MRYAAGSHAKTSASPGSAPDCPKPVQDSTGNWCEPFAWFDPASRSWRTWQTCFEALLSNQGHGLAKFSGTWPRAGLVLNGIAYRRKPSAPLTSGTGCGLLPTPTVSGDNNRPYPGKKSGYGLATELKERGLPAMLPTLRANKWGLPDSHGSTEAWRESGLIPTPRATDADKGGRGDLLTVLRGYETRHAGTLPTPSARDWRSVGADQTPQSGITDDFVNKAVKATGVRSGRMNPRFREWMMGLPIGWTELEQPGMASSPKFPNSSDAP